MSVSLEQISSAVRADLGLPETASVNIMFGPTESMDRFISVLFTAAVEGKTVNGRVVFQILEANSRMWGGSAILLDSRVELH